MAASPPTVGDRVRVLWRDGVRRCPKRALFHRSPHGCAALYALGRLDEVTPANGGPVEGHGNFVRLECPHECRMAFARDELRVVVSE